MGAGGTGEAARPRRELTRLPAVPDLPLADIRVLDLTQILAGPYCTMMLADLGADVVKVERPGGGDGSRQWGPPFVAGESAYFLQVNRNKRSIAIDLKHPDGVLVAQRLAAAADVVIENFLPHAGERFGLDAASLRTANPAATTSSCRASAGS
jgi:crotonobetainyl-CoA:carnitine CoA-transferase CaiB-like acyl-CoA transferase